MPTLASVMVDLGSKASEKTRAIYVRHGAPPDRTLGVSVADMKLIAKSIRKQQALACEIYASGIFDAMYLAGMVADGSQFTSKQLQSWADSAAGMPMIFEYIVPWVALESADPAAVAIQWIASKEEHIAAAGWCTLSGLIATTPDEELDLPAVEALLKSIPVKINSAPNRVRSAMNSFVIAAGTYVAPLHKQAIAVARQLGAVAVDVGDTACEIPVASERIAKAHASGRTTKRKTMRC